MNRLLLSSGSCLLALALVGCSSTDAESFRPETNNQDLAHYEADLASCRNVVLNDKALDKKEEGGILGAATGAVLSAITEGDLLEGIVVGAIAGAIAGDAKSDKDRQNAIVQCMQSKGYNVVVDQD